MNNSDLAKEALLIAQSIKQDTEKYNLPPPGGVICTNEAVLAISLFRNTRGYIERIVHQVNSAYTNGCYDACLVMIRRLLETLIIEVFEVHQIEDKIKDQNGDYLMLGDLISNTLNENKWSLGRYTKMALPRLKNVGNLSAHSRRFNAHRDDIDKSMQDLRVVVQELLYLAQFK